MRLGQNIQTGNIEDFLGVKKEGSKDEMALFLTVGVALTQWALIESEVSYLVTLTIGDHKVGFGAAFLRIPSFSTKVRLIQDLFRGMDEAVYSDIIRLLEKADRLSEKRNESAHGHVVNVSDRQGKSGTYFLPLLPKSQTHPKAPPRFVYNHDDIVAIGDSFRSMANDVASEARRLNGFKPEQVFTSKERGG